MSDLRKAAQMALEALEYHVEQTRPIHRTSDAIDALRAALSQHEEPVAYQWLGTSVIRKRVPKTAEADAWQPLYTAPPQRKPLTNEAMQKLMDEEALWQFARAIERSHGIGENK